MTIQSGAGPLACGQPPDRPSVDIVIPVLNEAHVLERSVTTVRAWLETHFPYTWRIVIVDNGSTDGTAAIARSLIERHADVAFLWLDRRGRGQALRHAWLQSDASAVCYMDVDLSTDLAHLTPLVRAVVDEGFAVATGSRLLPQSRTARSWRREFISRAYNVVVRLALGVSFSDAQCGFKAVNRDAVRQLVPLIQDESWFFDTELLFLAEHHGLRILDIPVAWNEDNDSRVKIVSTAWNDLKGIWRLRRHWLKSGAPATLSARRPS